MSDVIYYTYLYFVLLQKKGECPHSLTTTDSKHESQIFMISTLCHHFFFFWMMCCALAVGVFCVF